MRIIAGEFRSRQLKSLPGLDTRPTSDRLREALFNVLAPRIAGAIFLDAYAGTGSVGLEALSRGAARAIFIERSRQAATVIRENVNALNVRPRVEILQGRVLQYLPHRQADLVFLDPPYESTSEYKEALTLLSADPPPLVVVQHASRVSLDERYGSLIRLRLLRQGDNSLSFYEPGGIGESV